MTVFVDSSRQLLDAMHAACIAQDLGGVQSTAHSLKSCSATFGSVYVSEVSLELEMLQAPVDWQHLLARVADLEASHAVVVGILEDELFTL